MERAARWHIRQIPGAVARAEGHVGGRVGEWVRTFGSGAEGELAVVMLRRNRRTILQVLVDLAVVDGHRLTVAAILAGACCAVDRRDVLGADRRYGGVRWIEDPLACVLIVRTGEINAVRPLPWAEVPGDGCCVACVSIVAKANAFVLDAWCDIGHPRLKEELLVQAEQPVMGCADDVARHHRAVVERVQAVCVLIVADEQRAALNDLWSWSWTCALFGCRRTCCSEQ